MERTVLDRAGLNWLQSEAYDHAPFELESFIPLDDEMGAGHLNAKRAVQQLAPGEFDSDGADVPLIGWDYGHTSGEDDINKYVFDEPLLGGSFISATIAWDRVVNFETDSGAIGQYDIGDTFEEYSDFNPLADDVINDLGIFLVQAGETDIFNALAASVSSDSTIDHIFFEIPATGNYELWVHQFDADIPGGQDYAVAWWAAGVPTVGLNGDFNGNNVIDAADYTVWRDALTAGATTLLNDPTPGTVDESDFLYWRTHFGETMGSGAGSAFLVPEPTSLGLVLVGFVLPLAGRWRRTFSSMVSL